MTRAGDIEIVLRTTAIHALVILAFVVGSWIQTVFIRPRRPQSIMVFTMPDLPPRAPETAMLEPKVTPPEPKAPPPERTATIPEPTERPKPKVQVSRVKVTRTNVPPVQPAPKLSADEIRRILAAGMPTASRTARDTSAAVPGGTSDWYLAVVHKLLYDAWDQPTGAGLSAGTTVFVSLRVARDGTVVRSEIIRRSGHSILDQSVQQALDRVRKLPPLPDSWVGQYRDIQIAFELTREGG